MVVGILQFELLIHDAESLKDKRRVVRSVKDRLHREHQVSVAEVDRLENPSVAVLGLALVGREGRHVGEVLDQITAKLRASTEAELGDMQREVIQGDAGESLPGPAGGDDGLAAELMRRAAEIERAAERDGPPPAGRGNG
ncbi:MAG: DUF503 domain-containing protein [Phycisphaerales bacterium]|nr:DUF503 domain-containing protein [Phycisphaerales bacterium]